MPKQQYVQLVSPQGYIVAQRDYSGQPLSYYQDKVWRVLSDYIVRVVDQSDLVQPHKFMKPVPRQAVVWIYALEDSLDVLPKEPCHTRARFSVQACEFDTADQQLNLLIGGWNAFVNSEWVGTSEY